MEQISDGSVCDQFPPLSAKYPWLIAQNLKDEEHDTKDQFFYTIRDEFPHYRCQIPKLFGKRIRGFFHGWVILSNHPYNNKWSLWNQVTSKIISLPTLILEDGEYESIGQCCLSAPPNDPSSILLLTRTNKSTLVFCRLDSKKKKFGWTEMSYAYQLKRLTCDCKLIYSPTCCSGKVYALSTDGFFSEFVILVDIVVKYKEVVIKLMLFGSCPCPSSGRVGVDVIYYLKGSSTELYYIEIYYEKGTRNIQKKPSDVYLFKVDMTSINWEERECLKNWVIADTGYSGYDDLNDSDTENFDFTVLDTSREIWEEIDDLKDAIIFMDLAREHSVSYNRVIASDSGGFIHIRGEMGDIIYSYHVKTDTISLFPIPSPMLPTSHMLMWECRLEGDHGEAKSIVDSKVEMENNDEILLRSGTDDGVKFNESHLLNTPFNLLETIMELCVGVEYMNFRATCKQCLLAAPLIKWSNKTSLRKLQTYSLVSHWLMVVDKTRDIIIFTDPMAGDNYFMKNSKVLFDVNSRKWCSRFGWLLFKKIHRYSLIFFNPFTNELRELPEAEHFFDSFCFSAPPTSLDCMVVGFTTKTSYVYIHLVNRERTWREVCFGNHPHNVCSSTFYGGGDLYALCEQGELIVINNLDKEDYYSWKLVKSEAPKGYCKSSTQYFLGNFDQHSLLVSVAAYGEAVEVFKRNKSIKEWEKIDSLGKHAIYICGTTCLCIEAKLPKMENKIFFPRLHTKNKKVVFYSLDTCMYHTFDGESIQEHLGDFIGTMYHLSSLSTWIEPTWS
ncbi:hypothetical protein Tco_0855042 [Tanacetum coccineum]